MLLSCLTVFCFVVYCLLEAYSLQKGDEKGVDGGVGEELGRVQTGEIVVLVNLLYEIRYFQLKINDSQIYVYIGHLSARDLHANQVFKEASK